MKKLVLLASIAIMLILFSLVPVTLAETQDIDLSKMSYAELVALKDKINLAIWNSQEWQEVTVPVGVYQIGVDIPAGYWTISPLKGMYVGISLGYTLDKTLTYITDAYPNTYTASSVSWYLEEGYIEIWDAPAIFTPYAGKPDFGFK